MVLNTNRGFEFKSFIRALVQKLELTLGAMEPPWKPNPGRDKNSNSGFLGGCFASWHSDMHSVTRRVGLWGRVGWDDIYCVMEIIFCAQSTC